MPLPTISTPVVAQRLERAAGCEMRFGIEIAPQRQLHDRNVGRRGDQQERHEHAVIEAARRVGMRRQPRSLEQVNHARGERRIARCRIAELVGVFRKAGIVEDQRRLRARGDGKIPLEPMRRDQQDRTRPLGQRRKDAAQERLHRRPDARRIPLHEEAGTGAVRHEIGRQSRLLRWHRVAPSRRFRECARRRRAACSPDR